MSWPGPARPDVDAASQVLTGLGFTPLGDLGVPLRWAFRPPARLGRTNTYVVAAGALALRNHLAVRNVLRTRPDQREQYAAVKRHLGTTAATQDQYTSGKNEIVLRILAAAGLDEADRAFIAARQLPSFGPKGAGPRQAQ